MKEIFLRFLVCEEGSTAAEEAALIALAALGLLIATMILASYFKLV